MGDFNNNPVDEDVFNPLKNILKDYGLTGLFQNQLISMVDYKTMPT